MSFKTYTTYEGAKRAANTRPIIRILDDPTEIWIVVDRLDTDVMVYTTDGPQSRRYGFAGRVTAMDIASNGRH